MAEGRSRPAWVEVDLSALRENAATLAAMVSPSALCAVVKADGYGHGAVDVARAAIEGGAASLAVAIVEEAVELRDAGVNVPILLLSEPPLDAVETVVATQITPTLATPHLLPALDRVVRKVAGSGGPSGSVPVHVKVDTGMHRIGSPPGDLPALIEAIRSHPVVEIEGLWTHLPVADGCNAEDRTFTEGQLDSFDKLVTDLDQSARPRFLHVANSAAAIAYPRARHDMVRCGIALYGHLPAPELASALADATGGRSLRPVLSLRAQVAAVRRLDAGARPSYGRLRPLPVDSVVATVPVGYADGVPRALFKGGFEVLIAGRRRPLAGMVTMDQIVVDCGDDDTVRPGDEVTLLGRQGQEEVDVGEWAARLSTIGYEVLCGIGPRVPRITIS